MVLDQPPQRLPINPQVEVIRAANQDHLADMGLVMSEAFATSHGVNQRVARPEHLDDPDIVHYVIYSGDEPAACATVALCENMGGVWNVGTRYRFRRQRFATTIMLALLDDLRERGIADSMLMASPAGQPLYEALGYRLIGTTVYLGPPYYPQFR
jgi:hypothetical protein